MSQNYSSSGGIPNTYQANGTSSPKQIQDAAAAGPNQYQWNLNQIPLYQHEHNAIQVETPTERLINDLKDELIVNTVSLELTLDLLDDLLAEPSLDRIVKKRIKKLLKKIND